MSSLKQKIGNNFDVVERMWRALKTPVLNTACIANIGSRLGLCLRAILSEFYGIGDFGSGRDADNAAYVAHRIH